MIPLKDDNPTSRVPVVTVILILINIAIFVWEFSLPPDQLRNLWMSWGLVPAQFWSNPFSDRFFTPLTSMFLHGGLLHLGGNMLYLWVFGDNIEDDLGHFRFLCFYLVAGLAGAGLQCFLFPTSDIPMVGASGAIAGVLGAYLLLYPHAYVLTVLILIIIIRFVYIPAWVLLSFWIFIQFFQGTASLGMEQAGGGVAWFAHVGGFLAGVLVAVVVRGGRLLTR